MSRKSTATSHFKNMPCKYCGKPMAVGSNTRNKPWHLECGITATVDNARQMYDRSGPAYDRWVMAMARWVDTL